MVVCKFVGVGVVIGMGVGCLLVVVIVVCIWIVVFRYLLGGIVYGNSLWCLACD